MTLESLSCGLSAMLKHRYQRRQSSKTMLSSDNGKVERTEKRIVAVVGEGGSGKTCLIRQLVKEDVSEALKTHTTTLDESYFTIQKMTDGAHEQIQFIDTAPWMEFPVMHRLYIQTAHLVIVVYDVSSKTWRTSLTNMINEINNINYGVDIMVVGTHADEMNMYMNFTPGHVQEVIGNYPHLYVGSSNGFGINNLWFTLLTTDTGLTKGHLTLKDKVAPPKARRTQSGGSLMMKLAAKTHKSLLNLRSSNTL